MIEVDFSPQHIKICLNDGADMEASAKIAKKLLELFKQKWIVEIISNSKKPKDAFTLAEEDKQKEQQLKTEIAQNPIIEQILESFPGAKVVAIEDIK